MLQQKISDLTILNGGFLFDATKRDGSIQNVKISQLPIRKLERYASLQGDEAAMVEFFCDQPEGWDDELTPDAHLEILRIGEELNTDPFYHWIDRMKAGIDKATGSANSLLEKLPKGFVPAADTLSKS